MSRRPLLMIVAWLFAFAMVFVPGDAWAAEPCVVDVLELEPDERDSLRPFVCNNAPPDLDSAPGAEIDPILRKLVSRGGWSVDVALHAANQRRRGSNDQCLQPSDANPRALQEWATCTLRALLAEDRCSLRDRVEVGLEDLRTDGFPVEVGAEDLADLSRACRRRFEPEALANLMSKHILVTYFGGPQDRLGAIIGSDHPWSAEVVRYEGKTGLAQLLVLPQGTPTGIVVEQDNLDSPWIKTLSPREDLALRPRSDECLALDFAVDPDWDSWTVFVEGRKVALEVVEDGPNRFARAMVRVPIDPRESPSHHEVTVADADGWSMVMRIEQTNITGRCISVPADLTGRTHDRYGLTHVVVDEGCGDLMSAHASQAIGAYFEARGLELRQLDSLANIIRAFEEIEATLGDGPAIGTTHVQLDTRRVLADLAGETLRQSVSVLLSFEVRCNERGEIVVVGRTIDLREFNERTRSPTTGVALAGLFDVDAITVPDRRSINDGIGMLLGRLLGCTAVQLVDPPTVVDYYDRINIEYRILHGEKCRDTNVAEIGLAFVEDDPDVATLCHEADEIARLSGDQGAEVTAWIDAISSSSAPRANTRLLLAKRVEISSHVTDSATLPLTRPGRYLVWIRSADNRSHSARCFRAVSSKLAILLQSGGMTLPSIPTHGRDGEWLTLFRIEAGLAYPFGARRLGRVGGLLGYTYAGHRANVELDGGMRLEQVAWARHGVALGAFIGFDIPISRCVHQPKSWQRSVDQRASLCSGVARRSWSVAGNFGVGVDFGKFDLPAALLPLNPLRRDIDLELAIQLMLKVQLSVRTSFYFFHRVSTPDTTSALRAHHDTATISNDFSVVTLLGAGVAWIVQKR